MKKPIKKRILVILRIILSYVVSMAPPIVTYYFLRASGGIEYIIIYTALVSSLFVLRIYIPQKLKLIAAIVLILLFILGAVVIIIGINLTPSSAYLAWFRLVQEGGASGVLSYMFTMKVCFFSALFGGLIVSFNIGGALAGFGAMYSIILYAVFQMPVIAVLSLVFLLIAVLFLALKRSGSYWFRSFIMVAEVFLICFLAAWAFSRTEPTEFNLILDVFPSDRMTKAVVSVYPDFPFLYNIPGYGHQMGEKTIGGRPVLTTRPVFEVRANPGETIYLRTAAYEIYTGKGWVQNQSRIDSARTEYESFFTESDPKQYEDPISIEILIDFFSAIPHELSTTSVSIQEIETPALEYGSIDTGFLFEIPIISGTKIHVNRTASADKELENPAPYLQIPENIPEEISAMAEHLGSEQNPLEIAANIKNFLAANYGYSLDADPYRQGQNPAWEFLLNQRNGYCVHFATVFTLLSRIAGIPARYVSGFLVNMPFDSEIATVTGFSSHAWSEIWVPGRGWITQEATPPMLPGYYEEPDYFDLYNPFDSSFTGRQLSLIMGDHVPNEPEPLASPITVNMLIFVIVPIAIAAAALIYLIFIFFTRSSYSPGTVKNKLRLLIGKLIVKSEKLNLSLPGQTGWLRWTKDLKMLYPQHSGLIQTLGTVILRSFFSDRGYSKRDVWFIRKAYKRIFT